MTTVLLLTTGAASGGRMPSAAGVSLAPSAPVGGAQDLRVLGLASIRRLLDALARQRASADEGERVAALTELSVLAEAVVGDARTGPLVFDDPAAGTSASMPDVRVTPAVRARDTVAYQLLSLGYSARETADVVGGRISKQALDAAQRMLLVGVERDAVADYLDRQYKTAMTLRNRPGVSPNRPGGASPNRFNAAIEKYASLHRVDAAIVRAVIGVESAFDPEARSPRGAIGLMQLMPATARALGVDPSKPEENIEGGVRYLAELIAMFGGVELALVAYNGGPGFARRYARGETALYGETREYVRKVLRRLQPFR
jgi:soluble lytic murein transglycosylase-like protein